MADAINFNARGHMESRILLDEREDGSAEYHERPSHLHGYMDSCDGQRVDRHSRGPATQHASKRQINMGMEGV
jgi:hypothetical protein